MAPNKGKPHWVSILLENRIPAILAFFEEDNSPGRQLASVRKRKRSAGLASAGFGCGTIAVAIVIFAFGATEIWRRMAGAQVLLAIVLTCGGIYMVCHGIGVALQSRANVPFASSAQQACQQFYELALGEAHGDAECFLRALHLFPAPVLELYATSGWSYTGPEDPQRCLHCGSGLVSVAREDVHDCLCSTCGCATGAWDALRRRWDRVRMYRAKLGRASTFVVVAQHWPRADRRVYDVVVHVQGADFGRLKFRNVAFLVKDSWFLCSPEPVLMDADEEDESSDE